MVVDFSPITTVAVAGIGKVGLALGVGAVADIAAFLGVRRKMDRRLAQLVGLAAFAVGAWGTMHVAFA